MELEKFLDNIAVEDIVKIVISNVKKSQSEYCKIVIEAKKDGFQIQKYTEKQVFHENIKQIDLLQTILHYHEQGFYQADIFTGTVQYSVKWTKKGKCMMGQHKLQREEKKQESHNRKKNYLIEEGAQVPPLVDMGIFTKDGKVVRSMYDKFRQINRFLEIIEDGVSESGLEQLSIIDFGCGKSYLTFVVYYYFTYVKKMDVRITGLDLKAEVIQHCNEAAEKYGYEKLHFELGDINGYQTTEPVDMVITLHACDTATDYALYNAISWKAKMIFSVPCCQHELNQQIQSEDYSLMTRYGIIKERFSALATDAIRANLLECAGYKTQLLEFVDLSHTPKNILIRGIRRPIVPKSVKEQRMGEVRRMMEEFHLNPTLYQLLYGPKGTKN